MAVLTSTSSYWSDSQSLPRFRKLDRDLTVDVVVVGGGITGLTAAYLLKKEGRTVAVLDRGRSGGVDTSYTSAHLTAVTDWRLSELVSTLGEDHARASWDAGFAAIARIEQCIRDEQIDCNFAWVPGYLHADAFRPPTGEDIEELQHEARTAERLGFDARFVESVPFFDRPGVAYDGQARLHPRKYLAALARAIEGDGSFVFDHSEAGEVEDDPPRISVGRHTVTCGHLIVATHNPIAGAAGWLSATLLQTALSLYSTYVVGGRVPARSVSDALFWDTNQPYRYVRIEPHRGFDYVIFGGEDHKTGQEADPGACFDRLESALQRVCPAVSITHRWSGQVIETNDGLPYIGEMSPRQFAATGFAGNGLTFGTLAAIMAADHVVGRANPWSGTFDIGRTKIRGGLWDYLKENKDYPYYLVRDRFAGVESRPLRSIARGEGTVVDVRGKPTAAYRRDDGRLVLLSPTCTHMGCFVRWNAADSTWDCPCHGSRFRAEGAVLSGPAESPLKTLS
jgi:glycine/D-amino acid oxidase-like deaminating enzyme/nitrite reductase/ring-hydroxylating ferredoxin subunit